MTIIRQSHQLNSPALVAIAKANSERRPFWIDGLPYSLRSWKKKENRYIVKLVIWVSMYEQQQRAKPRHQRQRVAR